MSVTPRQPDLRQRQQDAGVLVAFREHVAMLRSLTEATSGCPPQTAELRALERRVRRRLEADLDRAHASQDLAAARDMVACLDSLGEQHPVFADLRARGQSILRALQQAAARRALLQLIQNLEAAQAAGDLAAGAAARDEWFALARQACLPEDDLLRARAAPALAWLACATDATPTPGPFPEHGWLARPGSRRMLARRRFWRVVQLLVAVAGLAAVAGGWAWQRRLEQATQRARQLEQLNAWLDQGRITAARSAGDTWWPHPAFWPSDDAVQDFWTRLRALEDAEKARVDQLLRLLEQVQQSPHDSQEKLADAAVAQARRLIAQLDPDQRETWLAKLGGAEAARREQQLAWQAQLAAERLRKLRGLRERAHDLSRRAQELDHAAQPQAQIAPLSSEWEAIAGGLRAALSESSPGTDLAQAELRLLERDLGKLKQDLADLHQRIRRLELMQQAIRDGDAVAYAEVLRQMVESLPPNAFQSDLQGVLAEEELWRAGLAWHGLARSWRANPLSLGVDGGRRRAADCARFLLAYPRMPGAAALETYRDYLASYQQRDRARPDSAARALDDLLQKDWIRNTWVLELSDDSRKNPPERLYVAGDPNPDLLQAVANQRVQIHVWAIRGFAGPTREPIILRRLTEQVARRAPQSELIRHWELRSRVGFPTEAAWRQAVLGFCEDIRSIPHLEPVLALWLLRQVALVGQQGSLPLALSQAEVPALAALQQPWDAPWMNPADPATQQQTRAALAAWPHLPATQAWAAAAQAAEARLATDLPPLAEPVGFLWRQFGEVRVIAAALPGNAARRLAVLLPQGEKWDWTEIGRCDSGKLMVTAPASLARPGRLVFALP